jgi:hypothetical protein
MPHKQQKSSPVSILSYYHHHIVVDELCTILDLLTNGLIQNMN